MASRLSLAPPHSAQLDGNSGIFSRANPANLLQRIIIFLGENPGDFAKLLKAIPSAVAQALANAGKFDAAASARAVAVPFATLGNTLSLVGAPLCMVGAIESYGKVGLELAKQARKDSPAERSYLGAWKEFLDATGKLSNGVYCVKDVCDLLVPVDKMSLVASKITGLVSLFGGVLGSVFALAKDGVSFALLHKDNRDQKIIAKYGEDAGAKVMMSRYREMKANANREIIFSVIKNIFNLTMSVIAALAILGGIAMAPSAAVIVFSVLTIGAVVFKVVSHVNKEQKKESELLAYMAELKRESLPAGGTHSA
jgi:hypothetical protein